MFRKGIAAQEGSAVVGFALAFPLIAFIFLATSDLVIAILQRERIATMTEQVLRNGVRLPHTVNLSNEIESVLYEHGYQVEVTSSTTIQNTAKLIRVDVTDSKLNARVYGVYEQSNQ